jgi:hypothetical protein
MFCLPAGQDSRQAAGFHGSKVPGDWPRLPKYPVTLIWPLVSLDSHEGRFAATYAIHLTANICNEAAGMVLTHIGTD